MACDVEILTYYGKVIGSIEGHCSSSLQGMLHIDINMTSFELVPFSHIGKYRCLTIPFNLIRRAKLVLIYIVCYVFHICVYIKISWYKLAKGTKHSINWSFCFILTH